MLIIIGFNNNISTYINKYMKTTGRDIIGNACVDPTRNEEKITSRFKESRNTMDQLTKIKTPTDMIDEHYNSFSGESNIDNKKNLKPNAAGTFNKNDRQPTMLS